MMTLIFGLLEILMSIFCLSKAVVLILQDITVFNWDAIAYALAGAWLIKPHGERTRSKRHACLTVFTISALIFLSLPSTVPFLVTICSFFSVLYQFDDDL